MVQGLLCAREERPEAHNVCRRIAADGGLPGARRGGKSHGRFPGLFAGSCAAG